MDMIEELEAEFSELRTKKSATAALIKTQDGEIPLERISLGSDFVAGITKLGLTLIPVTEIVKISAKLIPAASELRLIEFLNQQRNPVRISYRDRSVITSSWLLSVQGFWLRVAATEGVQWLPLNSVMQVQINPVENEQQH